MGTPIIRLDTKWIRTQPNLWEESVSVRQCVWYIGLLADTAHISIKNMTDYVMPSQIECMHKLHHLFG